MNASDTVLWSEDQCQWLRAMGYTVYLHGDTIMDATPPVAAAETTPPPIPQASPVRQRQTTPAAVAPAAPPPSTSTKGFSRRSPPRMPDKLMLALLRASGLDPAQPETQRIMSAWALDELRGNAGAKRALWPHLRALRRR